jgi:hypothetical protein
MNSATGVPVHAVLQVPGGWERCVCGAPGRYNKGCQPRSQPGQYNTALQRST